MISLSDLKIFIILYFRYKKLEEEFQELQSFTQLEKKIDIDYNNYNIMCQQLAEARKKLSEYEKEKSKYQIIEDEFFQKELQLCYFQER